MRSCVRPSCLALQRGVGHNQTWARTLGRHLPPLCLLHLLVQNPGAPWCWQLAGAAPATPQTLCPCVSPPSTQWTHGDRLSPQCSIEVRRCSSRNIRWTQMSSRPSSSQNRTTRSSSSVATNAQLPRSSRSGRPRARPFQHVWAMVCRSQRRTRGLAGLSAQLRTHTVLCSSIPP